MDNKLVLVRFRQSLPREVHETSQRKHTLTNIGMYRQSNVFIGMKKANKQASKRAPQEFQHATRDEVHVANAQATQMFRADMLERMATLVNLADQTWTFSSSCVIG